MATQTTITRRLIVEGRVQGVGFRWFATRMARAFDVGGYCRNRDDGSVEIFATGTPANLDAFREQIGIGPDGGRVDRITSEECPIERFTDFRTAF